MDNFTVIIDEPTTTTITTTTTIIPAIPEWIETMRYIKISLLALMFILIFCGNTFVLVALNNRKLRKNRMYFFLAHLSIADLVTGFFNVLPQLGWEIARRFYGGNILCKMIKFLQILGPYLSSYVLVMTAIDRYQAICHPLSNSLAHTRRSRWMVACAWIMSLLFCTPQTFIFSYQKISATSDDYECWATFPEPYMTKMYVTWYTVSVFIVPFIILTWTHYFICREIWLNWHYKRQSLLIKPETIHNQQQQNDTINRTKKSYSISSSLGGSVNQFIHRLSNVGINDNNNDKNPDLGINSIDNHSLTITPPTTTTKWYGQSRLTTPTTKFACRPCSSSLPSSNPAMNHHHHHQQQIISNRCPIHPDHYQFRHNNHNNHSQQQHRTFSLRNPSISITKDNEQKQTNRLIEQNESKNESKNPEQNKSKTVHNHHHQQHYYLKRSKSESELMYRRQEKKLKHLQYYRYQSEKNRRYSNRKPSLTLLSSSSSSSSISSISTENDHQNNNDRCDERNNRKRKRYRRNSIQIIPLNKNSNKIQTLSKCLDQEQQQHLMTRSISQRRPPPPPPPRPPSSSISSPSNQIQMTIQCICCKQCCPNCQLSSNHHHQQRKHSMKSNPDSSLSSKTMSYQCTTNGNMLMNGTKHSKFINQNQNITNEYDEHESFDIKNAKSDPNVSSSLSLIKLKNATTTPLQSQQQSSTSVSIDSSNNNNNVVNVFVPRNYHINTGGQPNKRMSNPRIHSMHGLTRAKIKTVKITLVVITCYVLCSLPFICVQLWAEYWPNAQESPIYSGPIIAILMLLPSLNSCVNPWIYIYFNPNLITLFCQFFKRKSSSDEPLSKSGALLNNNNPGGGAGGGGNGGGFKAKFQKHYRQTSESPDCSLSLTDNTTTTCHSTRLVTRQNDFLVDMNKPGAGFRYMATNRLNLPSITYHHHHHHHYNNNNHSNHQNHSNHNPNQSKINNVNQSISMNNLVRYCNDDQNHIAQNNDNNNEQQPQQQHIDDKESIEFVDLILVNENNNNNNPTIDRSIVINNDVFGVDNDDDDDDNNKCHQQQQQHDSQQTKNQINQLKIKNHRLNSLTNRLDRMWLKLSSNKNNGNNRTTSTTTKTTMIMIRSNKQQQKQQYPAKSSQLRLLNKATNVECVVNDDQYIV
uniref:Probable serine/threonine-protein kinase DDB_G0282963 n=1 Tax=Dermatophagoides pteronyssinus TaxID=6956 RepID=A0A6P6XMU1_DERPT|nr:probable serine/threonine-protein kinase DDB_G0282963 [Dermatophagoides pteronyssinus]